MILDTEQLIEKSSYMKNYIWRLKNYYVPIGETMHLIKKDYSYKVAWNFGARKIVVDEKLLC